MKCIIEIEMDNAAFDDPWAGDELARLLRRITSDVNGANKPWLRFHGPRPIIDSNGNKVGELRIVDQERPKVEQGYDAGPKGFTRGNY